MNIAIISNSASFPWGMAASSRVQLIAKGLNRLQHSVIYIGLRGANTTPLNSKKKTGSFDGVNYIYPGLFPVRPYNWILRRVDDVFGKWLSILFAIRQKKKNKLDLIILYSRSYTVVKTWAKVARLLNVKILLEICEWPLSNASKTGKKNPMLFCNKAPLLVDGVLPISEFIENKVKDLARQNKRDIPVFRIPILVDVQKFNPKPSMPNSHEGYFVYAGSFQYMDIARVVFDSMALLAGNGINVKLMITGGGNEKALEMLKAYAKEKNIIDNLTFTGYISEQNLIRLMQNAIALLAPIPNNQQTEARFPTKIGYYLASGRPVVTNPYGEVKKYLHNNESAFFLEDFSASALMNKIIELLSHPENGNKVGKRGQEVAHKEFHYANSLIGFDSFVNNISK